MDQTKLGQARKKHTETKESYLKKCGYTLRTMWGHEFKELQKTDPTLKQFVPDRMPPFYSNHQWMTKEPTLLKAVMENTLFGFLELDIHVPDSLLSYFEEMPPLFCNTDVNYNDIGPFMQQYVKDQGLLQKPRRLLISGMKAKKILLSSPYLRWLLQKGLVVTKIYQVIEYAQKRCFSQFVQDVSNARWADDINEDKKIDCWNYETYWELGVWVFDNGQRKTHDEWSPFHKMYHYLRWHVWHGNDEIQDRLWSGNTTRLSYFTASQTVHATIQIWLLGEHLQGSIIWIFGEGYRLSLFGAECRHTGRVGHSHQEKWTPT